MIRQLHQRLLPNLSGYCKGLPPSRPNRTWPWWLGLFGCCHWLRNQLKYCQVPGQKWKHTILECLRHMASDQVEYQKHFWLQSHHWLCSISQSLHFLPQNLRWLFHWAQCARFCLLTAWSHYVPNWRTFLLVYYVKPYYLSYRFFTYYIRKNKTSLIYFELRY